VLRGPAQVVHGFFIPFCHQNLRTTIWSADKNCGWCVAALSSEYQALLADTITAEVATKQGDEGKTILTSWSEAKKVLKLDPCYGKVPHHERESLWRRYVEDMQRWLKGGRSSVLKHERSSVANTEGGKQSSGLRYTPSNRR
jgi:transcription elongation regulator 1